MTKSIKVSHRYLRLSPTKISPYVSMLVGKNAQWTIAVLNAQPSKPAQKISALLKSGLAAAKDKNMLPQNLQIKSLIIHQGPRLKRRIFGSKGRAMPIVKRTSHVTLVLSDELNSNVKSQRSK